MTEVPQTFASFMCEAIAQGDLALPACLPNPPVARRNGTVYVALIDPHPRNQGRGIEMLRDAGVRVITNFLSEEAWPHLAPYLYRAPGRTVWPSGDTPKTLRPPPNRGIEISGSQAARSVR